MKNQEILEKFSHISGKNQPFVVDMKPFGEKGMHITLAQSKASELELFRANTLGRKITGSLVQVTLFNIDKPEIIEKFAKAMEEQTPVDATIVVIERALRLNNDGEIPKAFLDADKKLREPIRVNDQYKINENGELLYRFTDLQGVGSEDVKFQNTKLISRSEMEAIKANITKSVVVKTAPSVKKEELPS